MTLTELRYIVTLAKTEHFGRAAELCFVSQPTLSVAIKKLESELNVAIFERAKNSVKVTAIGDKIISQAKLTLTQAAVIKELAEADKGQLNTPLRVGAIHTIGPYVFPDLVRKMQTSAPGMPLYIEENYTKNLQHKLLEGELDAILIALPFEIPDIVTTKLYHEDFLMLLHPDHPWCNKPQIAAASLAETELLLLGKGHCFRDQVLESCRTLQQVLAEQHQATEGSSLETIRLMVASGLGSSVIPRSAAQSAHNMDHLITLPFSEPVPGRTVALAWRASFPRRKAIDCLLQALQGDSNLTAEPNHVR